MCLFVCVQQIYKKKYMIFYKIETIKNWTIRGRTKKKNARELLFFYFWLANDNCKRTFRVESNYSNSYQEFKIFDPISKKIVNGNDIRSRIWAYITQSLNQEIFFLTGLICIFNVFPNQSCQKKTYQFKDCVIS